MERKTILLILLVLGLLSLFVLYRLEQTVSKTPILTYNMLKDNIENAGAKLNVSGIIKQPYFSVQGNVLLINNNDTIEVFEYAKQIDAEVDARKISQNGSMIGNLRVDWIAPPHFYKKGKVIVSYVGADPQVLALLNNILGGQIAGESISNVNTGICRNKCGDGACQGIVCTAEGCPCPENILTCPKDCQPQKSPPTNS